MSLLPDVGNQLASCARTKCYGHDQHPHRALRFRRARLRRDAGGDVGRGARRLSQAVAMSGERLEVNVTFDERGYIGSAPELRSPVMALSLGGLRRKIEIAMLPDDVRVVLQLDGLAERERHRRRAQA
jgi:hypothetical protein